MTVRSYVKTAVSVATHLTGLSRAIALRYGGCGTIFGLHSIVEDDEFYPDYTLRLSMGKLERTLRWLRKRGVDLISLDEAVERLRAPPGHPFAAFTFDDGYADSLTRALPVMERFSAPFTVYVTTGMVTRQIDAWWFGLAALIRLQERIDLPGLERRFDCPDRPGMQRTFQTI